MKRNFVVSLFGSLMGFGMVLILLSSAGSAGARGAAAPRDQAGPDSVSAATPLTSTFTYQGQLKNGGVAVNGSCQMAFRLYDALSSGTLIGSPITTSVPVANGLFTVGLDFGSTAFDGNGRWLDIQVDCGGGLVPLTPRQPLTAAPYARFSAAPWVTSGSNLSYTGGNVGIGTITPTTPLHVVGSLANAGVARFDNGNPAGFAGVYFDQNAVLRGWVGYVNSNSFFGAPGTMQVGGASDVVFSANPAGFFVERMRISATTGNVGIGTTAPAAKLQVESSDNPVASPALRLRSSSTIGTWANLDNTSTGGTKWSIISTGSANGEGAGRLLFYEGLSSGTIMTIFTGTQKILMADGANETSGTWTNNSDRNVKTNFVPVDGRAVLAQVANLPVSSWNYKADDPSIRHIGPMAQDFYAAFNVGNDDKHIGTVDEAGVALAAIQALDLENKALKAQNASLEARMTNLEQNAQPAAFNGFNLISLAALALSGLALFGVRRQLKRGGRA